MRRSFAVRLLEKVFPADVIDVSDRFLSAKIPEFRAADPSLPADPVAAFLVVNRDWRARDHQRIRAACAASSPTRLWDGPFLQMPNTKNMAGWAQARTYKHNGQVIDHQTHLGLDLASTAGAPVPAANAGTVAFSGDLGIYGQAVILDHGQGVFSLYGHLSSLGVKQGDQVARGAAVGASGQTGMAGGDHLHFSDPRERHVRQPGGVVRRALDSGQRDEQARAVRGADGTVMDALLNFENLIALLTLTAMEIVLGIDNIVFLAILTGKLPAAQQGKARRIGLFLAMFMRIGLLLTLSWIMRLTQPLFSVFGHAVSGRDLILLVGGAFLIFKATWEIHDKLEVPGPHGPQGPAPASFGVAIAQIVALDIIFSLDSVLAAVGMARHIAVMVAAVVAAVGVMMLFADAVCRLIERHPTLKMLALSFLLLIGVMLLAEGSGKHIEKGYIYFAMAFSLGVELLNMRIRRHPAPLPDKA